MVLAASGSIGSFVLFLIIAVVIIMGVVKRKKKRDSFDKIYAEFIQWLQENGFFHDISYGDFLYDSVHNKWCKFGVRHIFSASETGSARTNTVKRGKDDTYEVIIETKIASLPVVRINCGTSKYKAQDIKATINIIRSNQK